MITYDEVNKRLTEGPVVEAVKAAERRIMIPVMGFIGATAEKRQEWGANGAFMEDVQGLKFINPNDSGEKPCEQVVKQKDGVLIMYDKPGLQKKIQDYMAANPKAVSDRIHLEKFIKFLAKETGDIYDTDTNYVSKKIKGMPAKEDIKAGQILVGVPVKNPAKAIYLEPGEEFQGVQGSPQTAKKDGLFVMAVDGELRAIQPKDFVHAYEVVNDPAKIMTKVAARMKENTGNDGRI